MEKITIFLCLSVFSSLALGNPTNYQSSYYEQNNDNGRKNTGTKSQNQQRGSNVGQVPMQNMGGMDSRGSDLSGSVGPSSVPDGSGPFAALSPTIHTLPGPMGPIMPMIDPVTALLMNFDSGNSSKTDFDLIILCIKFKFA